MRAFFTLSLSYIYHISPIFVYVWRNCLSGTRQPKNIYNFAIAEENLKWKKTKRTFREFLMITFEKKYDIAKTEQTKPNRKIFPENSKKKRNALSILVAFTIKFSEPNRCDWCRAIARMYPEKRACTFQSCQSSIKTFWNDLKCMI